MLINEEFIEADDSITGTPESEPKTPFINSSPDTVLENFKEKTYSSGTSVSSEAPGSYDSTEEFQKLYTTERSRRHEEDQAARTKQIFNVEHGTMDDLDRDVDQNEILRPKSRRRGDKQAEEEAYSLVNDRGDEPKRPSTRGPSTSTSYPARPKSVRSGPTPSEEEKTQSKNNSDDDDDEEDDEEYNDKNLTRIEGMNHQEDLTLFKSSSDSDQDISETFDLPEFDKEVFNSDMTHNDMSREELENLLAIGNDDDDGYINEDYLFPPMELPDLDSFDGDEEMQLAVAEKRWHEEVLERKRQKLRYKAQISENPGIHSQNGMYNAEDYEGLDTTPDIKDLFKYITMYSPPPASTQVEVKLKPFIPEYYPSVGDIDGFLKVIHPEITNDGLGVKVLDEPSAFQSDPSVLDLRLRAMAKQNSARAMVVKKVENVGKGGKIIENWIKDISDLHRSKPSPSVHYSKPMPDIDTLLQEWPHDFEKTLKNVELPPPDLDCDLKTYVDIVCNLLDIPIYKSRIQSLHVLATLHSTHKNFGGYGFGKQDNTDQRKLTGFGLSDSNNTRGSLSRQPNVEEPGVDRLEL